MNRLVILVLSLTFCLLSQAQTGWEKPVQFFTPNAASLGTYGQVPVNYFNGLAQVSIPLTTFKVNGYELPITLSYYAGGNKPDAHPGWVGLGWNLFAGGSINRIVNGIKDETTSSEWDDSHTIGFDNPGYYYRMDSLNRADWSSKSYLSFITINRQALLKGCTTYPFDTEPDEFQVNVGDVSASFYLVSKDSVKIKSKSNCNFKIKISLGTENAYKLYSKASANEPGLTADCFTYIKEIILTNSDGIKYYFGGDKSAIEFSFINGYSIVNTDPIEYRSKLVGCANTWHLKKIEIPNGEGIVFNYEKDGIPIVEHNNRYLNSYDIDNVPAHTDDSESDSCGRYSYTLIQPSYLTSIESNTCGRTMTFKRSKSTELDYNIYELAFNTKVRQAGTEASRFEFDEFRNKSYYMQLDSIIDTNKKIALNYTSSPDTRLKLDNIVFSDSKKTRINGYLFDYNSTDLPAYNSKMTDNWGYYNNKYYGEKPYGQLEDFRTANATYMNAEVLTKITYPTGGTTEFVYEPHDFSKVAKQFEFELNDIHSTRICGGLRIKKIINNDGNNHTTIREFEYKNEAGTSSSGILSGRPIYFANGTKNFNLTYKISLGLGLWIGENSNHNYTYRFGNEQLQNQLANTNGSHVTYSRVTEKLSDGSKTIYNYTNHEKFPDKEPEATVGNLGDSLPCNKFNSHELERGLLESVEYYKNTIPVKKEIYSYNSDTTRYNDYVKSINIYSLYGMIRTVPIKIYTFYPYLKSKTETTYDINGNNPVSSTTNYRYNDYRLLYFQSQSGSRSAADSVAVVTKYPFDISGSPYTAMTNKFILNYPVETIKYKGNSVIDGKLTTYKELIIANDSLCVPDKVFSTEISTPLSTFSYFNGTTKDGHYGLIPEMEFINYGPKGNLYELKDRKGISTTFLWSYNYQHPIAEIKNATYPQIETELGSSYISNLANSPNPAASDLTNLNLLRTSTNLPGTEISTFTYKPFVGMISKTDPRGVRVNYTYDTFGRLVLNQDDNNKILAHYGYAYHDNGPGYVLQVSLKPAPCYVQGVTDTVFVSVKGASGNYSYNWSLLNGTTVLATGSSNSNRFNITCSQVGSLTLKCIVTDNVTGRKIEKKKEIKCYSKPTLTILPGPRKYMINTTATVTATATGGSGNFTYYWVLRDGTNNSEGPETTFEFKSSQSGNKYLVCTVRDNLTKQTMYITTEIYYYTYPTATVSTGAEWYILNGAGTASVIAASGSGDYSYSWKLKKGSTELQTGTNSTSFSYICSQPETLTLECTVTDNEAPGNKVTTTKAITVYTYPTATVSTGANWYMIDGTGTASVSAGSGSGNYSYVWKLKNSGETVLQTGTNSTSFSYTCSQSGTLTVECTVTDNVTGEKVTSTKPITVYTYPTATVSIGASWYMIDGTGTASVSAGSGSGNYSYAWKLKNSAGTVLQTGANSPSIYYTWSQSGTITVECTVTDNITGQTASDSKTFTSYTYPTVTVGRGASSYTLNSTGTAAASAAAGSGNYSYSWRLKNSGGTVLQTGTNSASFSYTCSQLGTLTVECTVTDGVTGQTVTDSKTVSVYNPLTSTVSTGANWYMLNSTVTASVSAGGGSGSYSYSWYINGIPLTGTTATLGFICSNVGTNAITCAVTDNVTGQTVTGGKAITVYTYPTATVSTGASWYMINGTGTASVSAGSGSGNYSYTWKLKNSGGTVLQNGTNSTSFSYTCSQSGTLTVECTVTDNFTGQTVTSTKTITVYTYPTATVSTGSSWYMINGAGTASVSAGSGTGNYSYAWRLKNSGGTVLQTGINSTSFSYTCSQSGSLTVECTVTDNGTGQTVTSTKIITVYTYPTATVNTGSSWYMIDGTGTASVSASSGSGNYSYAWRLKNSGGTVLQNGTNSTPFSYTCSQSGALTVECTVTDNVTEQTATSTKTITVYTYPTGTVSTGSSWYMIDGTGTALVSAGSGTGNYSYVWKLKNSGGTVLQTGTNSTSFSYTCSQSGTLTVECTVTDNFTGQTVTSTKTITVYTYPTATVSTGSSWYMIDGTGTASVSAGSGSGNYSYAWKLKNSAGTVLQTGTNSPSIYYTYSQSGTITVECVVTDNITGQTASNSKTFTSYTYPTVTVGVGASSYTLNSTGTAAASAAAGSGNYSYSWRLKNSGGTVLQTGTNSASFSYACSQLGTLTVECTVTDGVTGQTVTDSKTVSVYNPLTSTVSTGANWYMLNSTVTASVSAGGGSGSYSYSWYINGVPVIGTTATLSFICSNVGTNAITCGVTDNVTGQTVMSTKEVTVYTTPTASVSTGATSYSQNDTGSASVSASGGSGNYSYAWSLLSGSSVLTNGTNSSSFSFNCSQTGTLTVRCIVTDNVTAQTVTATKNISCAPAVITGNFSLQSGYMNYYNFLSKTGSNVSFVLTFGLTGTSMDPGYDYLVAAVPTAFIPSTTRKITVDCVGSMWNITITPSGWVYCQIVSGSSFPMGAGVNLGGSYNL